MVSFDPDAAAAPDSGIFGLDCTPESARVVLVPVPFAATVSYGGGAERGPDAIWTASRQVDLYDLQYGRVYEHGICMLPADPEVMRAHAQARAAAQAVVDAGGAPPGDARCASVDAAGALVNRSLRAAVAPLLDAEKTVGVIGGDHSVPFAAIEAAAERGDLGILHVDAHADLRPAYEGFRWSHASIMHNVLAACPNVSRLVQVGVRDFGEGEFRAIHESEGRVLTHFDAQWRQRLFTGARYDDLVSEVIDALPERVWVSVDIDGLDPSLCPNTGTPVPGGLQFAELAHLLHRLAKSGRRMIGFDLVEVSPGEDDDNKWDGNVGARVLYKLCGAAMYSR